MVLYGTCAAPATTEQELEMCDGKQNMLWIERTFAESTRSYHIILNKASYSLRELATWLYKVRKYFSS